MFRQRRDVVVEGLSISLNEFLRQTVIEWHGVKLNQPDWREDSRSLAFTLRSSRGRYFLHCMLNAYWEALNFELPPVPAQSRQPWRRWIDTAVAPPHDNCNFDEAAIMSGRSYLVQPRSSVFLGLWVKPESITRRLSGSRATGTDGIAAGGRS